MGACIFHSNGGADIGNLGEEQYYVRTEVNPLYLESRGKGEVKGRDHRVRFSENHRGKTTEELSVTM